MDTAHVPENPAEGGAKTNYIEIPLGESIRFVGDSMAHLGLLAKKLVAVMKGSGYVQKTGHNSHNDYNYATEKDFLDSVRPALTEQGVFLFSSVRDETITSGGKNSLTRLTVEFTFVDSETGAAITVMGRGQGQDYQDKGGYKAFTGAMKYLLGKSFLIPTGDDPEEEFMMTPAQIKGMKNYATEKLGLSKSEVNEVLADLGFTDQTRIHNDYKADIAKELQRVAKQKKANQQANQGDGQPVDSEENVPEAN